MYVCRICGGEFASGAGLASHRRAKHGRYRGPNRLALEETLAILRGLGRIENVDSARVQTLRSLTDQLDTDPSNAQMWKCYREALEELMHDDRSSDVIDELLAEINRSPVMGHSAEE